MRQKILKAALAVAEKTPLWLVTRKAIARKADCAPSLVSYYLGTQADVITAIVERAILEGNDTIVRRAKAMEHPAALALSV